MGKAAITVVGNVGRMGELKFGKSGRAFIKMSVASTDRVKDGNGDWADGDTTWYDVTSFGVLAEAISDNITKGKMVIVLGNLKRTEYELKDGGTGVSFEVLASDVGIVPFRNKNSGGRSDGKRVVRQEDTEIPF